METVVDRSEKLNAVQRAIAWIERTGNRLPHPFWLFWIMAGIVVALSFVLSLFDVSVTLPDSGEVVEIKNMFSLEGLAFAADSALDNFGSFPPVGLVVGMILGISIAEASGLMNTLLRASLVKVSGRWVTFFIAFASMFSHVMGDSSYIVMIPLGALAYRAVGRSPVLGVLVAFVSVSASFNASPLVTPSAAIRASLTTAAAQTVEPEYVVTPVSTYYYAAVASIVLSVAITLVVELVLAKRPEFAEWSVADDPEEHGSSPARVALEPKERRGLFWVAIVTLAFAALVVGLLLLPGSALLGEGGSIVNSVVILEIAVFISVLFGIAGYVYGRINGTIGSLSELPKIMADGVIPVASVLVLFFAAAQFLAYFEWSGLGALITVEGAEFLQMLNAPDLVVLVIVILVIAFLNLVITSGTAMWAILAPVLVPMMMYVGLKPEATLAAFMIGDSSTGPVTPMNAFFILALGYVQKYRRDAGIGTVMSFTIPCALVVLVVWTLLFIVWYVLGLPLGPGGYLY